MYSVNKFDFEKETVKVMKKNNKKSELAIDEKYDQGYSRVVTENGAYKVSLIKDVFSQDNYNLHPDYQRRITWDNKKRSKLIESLIINIPIPPVFLYEYEFDKYEIMDGLQRISAIVDFYNDKFKLTGLTEWSELNGKKYSKLPVKIKEGIDRRQLQVITLLKESASSLDRADMIKRLVFERLNTGGVKLQPQEIRNAIYKGEGNKMCYELSQNIIFRKLWDIPVSVESEVNEYDYEFIELVDDEKLKKQIEKHVLYKRMYDVELVLRYFAMRYLDEFDYQLSEFLDNTLIVLNTYSENELEKLKEIFIDAIEKAYKLFGDAAFKYFADNKWSTPAKMIYDPMMIVLSQHDIQINDEINIDENLNKLSVFYLSTVDENGNAKFDGKHQSKDDIQDRVELLDKFLRNQIL